MSVNGTMVKKYREMGYDVKQYDIIELPIEKLSKYSHKKVLCACDVCGEEKEVKYNNYCKYIENDTEHIYTCKICNLNKRKKTCLKKYGVDNVSKNDKVKSKVKQTMKENGTDYGFNSQSYKDTIIKNYGVENIFQSEEIKTKIKNTNLEKYGAENPSQSYEIHKKQHSGYILKHHNNDLYYRGSYEKDFIDYCLEEKIEIENFKGSIDYFFEGKNRKYFPDFFIRNKNMIIEVKSLYTYELEKEQNEAKKEAAINNGFQFKFIIDKDYNFL
jgi:hypothetical protein